MSWNLEPDFPLSGHQHDPERYLFFHPHHGQTFALIMAVSI